MINNEIKNELKIGGDKLGFEVAVGWRKEVKLSND